MRAVFGLVLVAGVGLAGAAVYMVRGQMEAANRAIARERAAMSEIVPTVEVIAMNRQITYGEPLTPDDVQVIRYAEPFLPEGVFLSMEELFPEGEDVSRQVMRQMEENEPVLAVKVTDPGEAAGLTTRMAAGMRAFAITVDVASGVSGFLRPGDRVDVYWTGVAPGGVSEITRLIQNALTLIAVDQTTDDNMSAGTIARTVTVEATPEQVAILAQAQSTGRLSLSLVPLADDTVSGTIEVDQGKLLDIEETAPVIEVQPEAPEICTVRERKGEEVVETQVDCPD